MKLPDQDELEEAVVTRAHDLDHVVGYVLEDLHKLQSEGGLDGANPLAPLSTLRRHYVEEGLSGRVFVLDAFTAEYLDNAENEEED